MHPNRQDNASRRRLKRNSPDMVIMTLPFVLWSTLVSYRGDSAGQRHGYDAHTLGWQANHDAQMPCQSPAPQPHTNSLHLANALQAYAATASPCWWLCDRAACHVFLWGEG